MPARAHPQGSAGGAGLPHPRPRSRAPGVHGGSRQVAARRFRWRSRGHPPGVLSRVRDRTLGHLTPQPGARHPMTHSEPSPQLWPALLGALAVTLLLLVLVAWLCPTQIGNAGAWLHFVGLLVVASGLVKTRNELRGYSNWQAFKGAMRRLLTRSGGKHITEVVDEIGKGGVAVSGEISVPPPEEVTDRLERLELDLKGLRGRMDRELDRAEKARRSVYEKVEAKVREEAAAREAAVQEVRAQLRRLTIGGLRMESVGLTWLASGFLVATWPECVLWLWNLLPLPAP